MHGVHRSRRRRFLIALLGVVASAVPIVTTPTAAHAVPPTVTVSWAANENFGYVGENLVGPAHYYYATAVNGAVGINKVTVEPFLVALPGTTCIPGSTIPQGGTCRLIVAAHPTYIGVSWLAQTLSMTFSTGVTASTTASMINADGGPPVLDYGSVKPNSVTKKTLNLVSESWGVSRAALNTNMPGIEVDPSTSTCWNRELQPNTTCTVTVLFRATAIGGWAGIVNIDFVDDRWGTFSTDFVSTVAVIPSTEQPAATLDDPDPRLLWGGFQSGAPLDPYTWQWGTAHSSATKGAKAFYMCHSCTGIAIWATKGPDRGNFIVYADGQPINTISGYAPALTRSSLMIGLKFSGAPVQHQVIVEVNGSHEQKSTGNWVEIDAITVVGSP